MMKRATDRTSPALAACARWFQHVVGAEVKDGEWRLVLLFFVNLFLLLTAYYILKVIREPLILLGGGAVSRSYARGLEAGLLVALIPVYSALANRFEPARLVAWIGGFFIVSLGGFCLAGLAGASIGFAFFVWLGIFSTASIAQFWSLANDVMSEEDGKRLFPLIAVGGAAGGILGAQLAARALARSAPQPLMLVAAGLLVVCLRLTRRCHREGVARRSAGAARCRRDPRGGFRLIVSDGYLSLIGLSMIALNLVTATGDFILAQVVSTHAHSLAPAVRARYVGAFYGDLETWITIVTTLAQIFLVARIFKVFGVGKALSFMPVMLISGYGLFWLAPLLSVMTAVKVAESTADYSLQNTIQQALFLPTSRDAKYKAKWAIDTLGKRLGDLSSTALVFVGSTFAWGPRGFAFANVVVGMVWACLTVQLGRRRAALGEDPPAMLRRS